MAINKALVCVGLFFCSAAWSREAASPSACASAASGPDISASSAAVAANPDDLKEAFRLADLWSDAGCFSEALQVLETAERRGPASKELTTRIRVSRSLIGEEHFFDRIERSDAQAALNRDVFRCSNIGDLDACVAAIRMRPDDATLLLAHGNALVRAGRPDEAISRYERAAVLDPNQASAAQSGIADAKTLEPHPGEETSAPEGGAAPPRIIRTAKAAKQTTRAPVTAALPPAEPAVARRYSNEATGEQTH